MSASPTTKAALQKELKAKDALLQEQEMTIDRQRSEIMDLRSRLTQQRGMARELKKQRAQ